MKVPTKRGPKKAEYPFPLSPYGLCSDAWCYEDRRGVTVVVEFRSSTGAWQATKQVVIPWRKMVSAATHYQKFRSVGLRSPTLAQAQGPSDSEMLDWLDKHRNWWAPRRHVDGYQQISRAAIVAAMKGGAK